MVKFASLLLGASLLAAGVADARNRTADATKTDPNKVICRSNASTGSRLSQTKQCMTAAQWAESSALDRRDIERVQNARYKNQ